MAKKSPAKRRAVAPTKVRRTIPAKKKSQSWTSYHDDLSALAAKARKAGDKELAAKFAAKAGRVAKDHPTVMSRKRKGKRSGPGTYPWKQCIEDQRKRYPKLSKERRAAICGAIRARSRKAYPAYWSAKKGVRNPTEIPPLTGWRFNQGSGQTVPHFSLKGTHGSYYFIADTGQLQFLDSDGRFFVLDKKIQVKEVPGAVEAHVESGSLPGVVRQTARRVTGADRFTGRPTKKVTRSIQNPEHTEQSYTLPKSLQGAELRSRVVDVMFNGVPYRVYFSYDGRRINRAEDKRGGGYPSAMVPSRWAQVARKAVDKALEESALESRVGATGNPVILTDAHGRPIPKPEQKPGESFAAYTRRYHAWRDKVADMANKAFDEGLSKGLSKGKKSTKKRAKKRAKKNPARYMVRGPKGSLSANTIEDAYYAALKLGGLSKVKLYEHDGRNTWQPVASPWNDDKGIALYTAEPMSPPPMGSRKAPGDRVTRLQMSHAQAQAQVKRAMDRFQEKKRKMKDNPSDDGMVKAIYKDAKGHETDGIALMRLASRERDPNAKLSLILDAYGKLIHGYHQAVEIQETRLAEHIYKQAARARAATFVACGLPRERFVSPKDSKLWERWGEAVANPSKKTHAAHAKKAISASRRDLKAAMKPGHASARLRLAMNAYAHATRAYWAARDAGAGQAEGTALKLAGEARNIVRHTAGLPPIAFVGKSTALAAKKPPRLGKKKAAKSNPKAKAKGRAKENPASASRRALAKMIRI